jgi:uncharacterized membrane protein
VSVKKEIKTLCWRTLCQHLTAHIAEGVERQASLNN